MLSIYDFEVTTIENEKITLDRFRGKVLLIVNVASRCGFTPQYEGLEALYAKYKDQGFEILAFPSNQFAKQEPEDNDRILQFCRTNYGVTFPMFSKIDVNGKASAPLYRYLKSQKSGIFGTKAVKWNFTKFLVNQKGEVIRRFAPSSTPISLETSIARLL